MLELIEHYEDGLKSRIYEIVNNVVGNDLLEADYVHGVEDVDILPPIMYPSKNMNAAVNFYTHACEGCTEEQLAARTQQRQESRGVPYLFLKPTRGAIIGSGDDIVMPYGRDRIEWEVELAIVFGTKGKYISARRAYDHVFGYLIVAGVLRVVTAPVRTGSSVRAMTHSRPKGPGLFQRSSTAIRWSACTRAWSSTA
jgi:2-keto-4-pentenoate hydratase/2-oxohepta-3-ene-1,7-dioic acid hydratase in catechol pathway